MACTSIESTAVQDLTVNNIHAIVLVLLPEVFNNVINIEMISQCLKFAILS